MSALRTTIVSLSFTILTAASALAGAPLSTDDARTIDVGAVEIGIGSSYTYDKEASVKTTTSDAELSIGTGLYKNLSINMAIPYLISERVKEDGVLAGEADGLGDMTIELKYAFAELAGVNLAIKPAVIIPTGKSDLTENHWQYGATLIATKELEEGKYALHANLGYEHYSYDANVTGTRSNLWSGSVAGEMEVTKGLFAVADLGLATNPDEDADDLPVYALTGARYEINDNFEVNAGVKFGLTTPEDDLSVLYGLLMKF
ncbi:MAG: transporter [Deltaproteobacteria bacterium]|nr:transporter [Deltaproteobacteria bacterium]